MDGWIGPVRESVDELDGNDVTIDVTIISGRSETDWR